MNINRGMNTTRCLSITFMHQRSGVVIKHLDVNPVISAFWLSLGFISIGGHSAPINFGCQVHDMEVFWVTLATDLLLVGLAEQQQQKVDLKEQICCLHHRSGLSPIRHVKTTSYRRVTEWSSFKAFVYGIGEADNKLGGLSSYCFETKLHIGLILFYWKSPRLHCKGGESSLELHFKIK